jgi:hypothetical protein
VESRTALNQRAFSLRRALNVNKEYKAIVGLFVLIAILAAKAVLDR